MPLVVGDYKALEWLGAVWLSKDQTGYKEILDGVDQHSLNQSAFKLPSRLIAKTFVFRLIYGGGAWSYANDFNFMDVSDSEKFWQSVIDQFYFKYEGIARWHNKLVETAMADGKIMIPTGRSFKFKPEDNGFGTYKWPRTKILNYPVQGLGADLMCLARVETLKRIRRENLKDVLFVSTVHDSLVFDTSSASTQAVAEIMFGVWKDLPKLFSEYFECDFDLPCKVEIKAGPNLKEMKVIYE